MKMVQCAGCDRPILDRFLLNVLDRSWHTKCVQCCDCRCNLTDKCFSRDGKLFCRNDFFKCEISSFYYKKMSCRVRAERSLQAKSRSKRSLRRQSEVCDARERVICRGGHCTSRESTEWFGD
ncbi:hypothetical protein HPB49_007362 [Dermacentor silvarum]|uniref:Uncharacterized protein n=1 Tax=Dermacentor silvarum TaxID=543639 RepID=A0ACB8D3R5_DERSI|nr:hypothetical protein HPB49_007362 [Dermacentor silvarum]